MNSDQLRQSFLDFFEEKGHCIVPSASLLPTAPNLLFTNAGMNQFVPYFLDERKPPYPRAVDTQKCIRAGGKHNDLEEVGFDTYHHTFFEMLGNWSFGDYFKKEAIEWAWELITERWELPKERLYMTVYRPGPGDPSEFDSEAYHCWSEILRREGLDPDVHIINGDKEDNFWMMGETGPCGPCSEIHLDLTEKGDTGGKLVNKDSPYCMEFWNLVFIQFNAKQDGTFEPLANRHVDTGMGFERVAGFIATTKNFQDFSRVPSNYDSDVFQDIFNALTEMTQHQYQFTMPESREGMSEMVMKDCAFRVIADHIRTLCFSIADGIIPGNEGRNYVLRRILRRGVFWANQLGLKNGSLTRLVKPVVQKFGKSFPELREQEEVIERIVASEEEAFERTIDRGLRLFEKFTDEKNKRISGPDAFTLQDTYGFPLDLTQLIADERGLTVDTAIFEEEMTKQRNRARAAQQKSVITVRESTRDTIEETQFVGFDQENILLTRTVLKEVLQAGKSRYLVFEKTPFYAEMGGQVGDRGTVQIGELEFKVKDTVKDEHGRFLHEISTLKDDIQIDPLRGHKAILRVNSRRRNGIQRHHSATHVLHHALRSVLGSHVRQAGSLVEENRLRFDFSHFDQPSQEELRDIELMTNRLILGNDSINWREVPFDKKPENCIAFFGEKYGDVVRVVDIGGWSLELCGGTHVRATGEIGLVKIVQESAIAAGTRRIEAVAGESAFNFADKTASLLNALSLKLSCQPEELEDRFRTLLESQKNLERELRNLKREMNASTDHELLSRAVEIRGIPVITTRVEASNPNEMRERAVQMSRELTDGVIILGSILGSKVTVLALCSKKSIETGFNAGTIVREITAQLGGRGGGKPDFAMGGGQEPEKLESVLADYQQELSRNS